MHLMSKDETLATTAEHIAEYFSHDACFWPAEARRAEPTPIRWTTADTEPVVRALVDELRAITARPFRWADHPDAVSIVSAGRGEHAAAVEFWFDHRPHDRSGVRYELEVSGSGDVYPGWFSLAAT